MKPGRALKKLDEAIKKPNVEIWFEDEVHFKLHATITRMWAPIGHQPKILFPPNNQKLGYFGAVNPRTGELFTQMAYPFNSETCEWFFRSFIAAKQKNDQKLVVVLDNARWHKRATKNLMEEFPGIFEALYLPPYSPDLNPIERVWRITRRKCTHNKHFEVLDSLGLFFTAHSMPNSDFKTLCAIN
jgi:hypothetical protein